MVSRHGGKVQGVSSVCISSARSTHNSRLTHAIDSKSENIYTTNVHVRARLYECENMVCHALSCCSDRQGLITSFHWSIIMERTRCIM